MKVLKHSYITIKMYGAMLVDEQNVMRWNLISKYEISSSTSHENWISCKNGLKNVKKNIFDHDLYKNIPNLLLCTKKGSIDLVNV